MSEYSANPCCLFFQNGSEECGASKETSPETDEGNDDPEVPSQSQQDDGEPQPETTATNEDTR
jgi:hypothetical protein